MGAETPAADATEPVDGASASGAPPVGKGPFGGGGPGGGGPGGGGPGGPTGGQPGGSGPGSGGGKPGVREQLGRVRTAATALFQAHLDLLKAELAVIGAQIGQIAAQAGAIVGLALYAVALLAIGGTLFLGEWLFGSIGWGVLHGLLVAVAAIVSLALLIIEAPRALITRPLVWGLVVGVATTIVLGLNVPRQLSEVVGAWVVANLVPTLDPAWAPVVVAMVFFAIVFAIVGLIIGVRSRSGGLTEPLSGLLVGALLGALFGILFGGLEFSWQVAAAIGLSVGLVTWIALMITGASRADLDPQARFEKLWPRTTYETALETKEWLEQEWTKRLRRPGSR